jgi:hypothetical protein
MRSNTKGIIIGSIGAVFLSLVSSTLYDFIKGNDLFATVYRFLVSSYHLLVKKIAGIDVPVWVLLLIALAILTAALLIIQKLSERNKKQQRTVRYRLVRQPNKRG